MALLPKSILDLLNEQYAHETENALIYDLLASNMAYVGFNNIEKFFNDQACGERSHAALVKKYIEDRNEIAKISRPIAFNVEAPIYDLFNVAQGREILTTEKLYSILTQARVESDYMTEQWLLDPAGLIKEQVEEENIIQSILDRIKSRGDIQSGEMLHDIDVWIGTL